MTIRTKIPARIGIKRGAKNAAVPNKMTSANRAQRASAYLRVINLSYRDLLLIGRPLRHTVFGGIGVVTHELLKNNVALVIHLLVDAD